MVSLSVGNGEPGTIHLFVFADKCHDTTGGDHHIGGIGSGDLHGAAIFDNNIGDECVFFFHNGKTACQQDFMSAAAAGNGKSGVAGKTEIGADAP